ncbi:aminoglycoside phosphotransferase family protein [Brachybacterium halotolerans subsp. kimchii]|uniref:phosphotransferase family protein n=1 Tax=Brachybacterium halotolerans TaxID=2795215 RepID=UPI001E3D82D2|nr:phosphotransferase [Brachybacterium halotolerans]UEJ84264.1 aminoglycoside phosphotransferase family protein [Brachybacterium halotolerans subsp. kimchii]
MEESLVGGNMTPGVVRAGDTVPRPRGPRSLQVGAALPWLASHGFQAAPGYLGTDEQGRDVFEFIEGATTEHPLQRDERAYGEVARILHHLHALTHGSDLVPVGTALLHGDPGPSNVICRDGLPVALIDWDTMHAGDPLEDVGYAAWTWCIQSIGGVPVQDQARRLAQFRDAYDSSLNGDDMPSAVFEAQQRVIDAEQQIAKGPGTTEDRLAHSLRAVEWASAERSFAKQHQAPFLSALR